MTQHEHTLIDFSQLDEQQKEDFAYYSIVPGPVHNNFNVCDPSCYVCTYEHIDKERVARSHVDIYVINHEFGQTVLYREDSEWEGSFGSTSIEQLIRCLHWDLYRGMFNAMTSRGVFNWQRKE